MRGRMAAFSMSPARNVPFVSLAWDSTQPAESPPVCQDGILGRWLTAHLARRHPRLVQ